MTTYAVDPTLDPDNVHVLARNDGPHLHVMGQLATIKATAGDSGSLTAVEVTAREGFGPPLHLHRHEDELIVVLEGDVLFLAGDRKIAATAGACAYLPHGIPHTFQVQSETARMLSVTASAVTTPIFDQMFRAMGTVAAEADFPRGPTDLDPTELVAINAAHGVDVLGPPPGLPRPNSGA